MFRKFTALAPLLALLAIVFGTYQRWLEPACPDCPPNVDALAPWLEQALGWGSNWTYLAHRHLAGALAVATLTGALWAFAAPLRRGWAIGWSWLALAAIGGQVVLGIRATGAGFPALIWLHGMLAMLTLTLLFGVRASQSDRAPCPAGFALRGLARLGLLALLAQIALGLWVGVNHAGLACADFPTCFNTFNPPVDYERGFHIQLPGTDGSLPAMTVSAQAAIHWVHRIAAVIVFVLLSVLYLGISGNPRYAPLSKSGLVLGFLLLVQVGLGVLAIRLQLPLAVALGHSLVSALLLLNVLQINLYLRAPAALPAPLRELEEQPAAVVPPVAIEPVREPEPVRLDPDTLFSRLKSGLGKTRSGLTGFLANVALGRKTIDRDLLEEIEAQLLMADIGVKATGAIIADLTAGLERSELADAEVLMTRLKDHLYQLIEPVSRPLVIPPSDKPFVILVVGVNGVGKTTTIGKLAKRLQQQGKSVMLAAGDTFRAAAVEQLQTWGERNHIPVVAQSTGADSASVIFDGIQSATAKGYDVLIADTAGRLHTKSNLMEELAKIKRIMAKLDPSAPHEVLLVLDAGTGQNAISQARQFNEAVSLSGLVVTKLDGTAKGGVTFALASQFGIPIRYIGVGEGIDDLQDFDARRFIDALFA
ncbi:MAG: signal recognition particle-docking protein FtsY [Methylococcaceae bacterium]|nr:signal recognition particle-docking protein FtsY [Methylococcaceae bacterium]